MALSSAMFNGVSGLNSFSTALEVTSDNVANAGTTGFKSNTARFGDLVSSYYSTLSNDTDRRGAGSAVLGIATDFAQGPFVSTSSWSDMAINGPGYFSLKKPIGVVEGVYEMSPSTFFSRDGGFLVSKEGYLVNLQGYHVLDEHGGSIRIEEVPAEPAFANYYVDNNGQIWGYPVDPDRLTDPTDPTSAIGKDPVKLGNGRIGIYIFPNEGGLIRQGGNLFVPGPESKDAILVTGQPNLRGDIAGFTLENSNVDLAKEMVNMIIYQSSYNANTKSITTSRDMLETTVNLIR